VLLEDQNRTRWTRDQISEALPLIGHALRDNPGTYALQAAISAEHCKAARAEDTNWKEIVRLYDQLERVGSSPVVSLNRAVAVGMAVGPSAALAIIDTLANQGELEKYHLFHAARADLLRRVGSRKEAAKSYLRAIALVTNERERSFLERRLRETERQGS
jgi:RNA polymerase sigma-70 factor (ECF subfamily)